jgi:hypothetical protein
LARVARLKSNSTRFMSESSSCVSISLALRGAQCGDDPGRPAATLRRYHDQQAAQAGPAVQPHASDDRLGPFAAAYLALIAARAGR